MGRAQEIEDYCKNKEYNLLKIIVDSLPTALNGHIFADLLSKFNCAMNEAFEKVQKHPTKGTIEYICISFLHTSLNTQEFDFRVDCYNENFYLDETECESYFSIPILFNLQFDYSYFERELRKKYIRVMEYEIWDQVLYFQRFRLGIGALLLKAIVSAVDYSKFAPFSANVVHVLYGGFWDKTIELTTFFKEEG